MGAETVLHVLRDGSEVTEKQELYTVIAGVAVMAVRFSEEVGMDLQGFKHLWEEELAQANTDLALKFVEQSQELDLYRERAADSQRQLVDISEELSLYKRRAVDAQSRITELEARLRRVESDLAWESEA